MELSEKLYALRKKVDFHKSSLQNSYACHGKQYQNGRLVNLFRKETNFLPSVIISMFRWII